MEFNKKIIIINRDSVRKLFNYSSNHYETILTFAWGFFSLVQPRVKTTLGLENLIKGQIYKRQSIHGIDKMS